MGILNYLLNQRPENRRKQELHDIEMASYQAQIDALKAWRQGGMQGPPPAAPAISSGGSPAASQVPPMSGGAAAVDDPMKLLLGNADKSFGMTMDKGVTSPLSPGVASPMNNSANTAPSLAETLVQQSSPASPTSLSSSYEPLKRLAMAYIESGDPAAAQQGMEILADVAAAEQGASQFDRTAHQTDTSLAIDDRRVAEAERAGGFNRNTVFPEDVRQFNILDANTDFANTTDRIRALTDRTKTKTDNLNPFGKIQPGDYTPESLAAYYQSITAENPLGNHSLLEPRENASAQTQKTYNELSDRIGAASNRMYSAIDIGRKYAESKAVQGQAANASELLKDVFGTQDGISALRTRLSALRNDYVLDKLPPGVASDKDVALAMEGFIDPNTTDKELVQSYLNGIAKVELASLVEYRFKSQYIAQRNNTIGMNEAWANAAEGVLERAFASEGFTWDGEGNPAGGEIVPPASKQTSEYESIFEKYRSENNGGLANPNQ